VDVDNLTFLFMLLKEYLFERT